MRPRNRQLPNIPQPPLSKTPSNVRILSERPHTSLRLEEVTPGNGRMLAVCGGGVSHYVGNDVYTPYVHMNAACSARSSIISEAICSYKHGLL